tara:strand:+ start:5651 stop:7021 length:1371 start_codon:yes stop_codon:yes gene_type:complete
LHQIGYTRTLFATLALLGACLSPSIAAAVEFRLDGLYRFEASLFDTLSLNRDADDSEGTRNYLDHRLRLTPHIRLSPQVHVFVEFDVMDAMRFGSTPEVLAADGQFQDNGSPFNEPIALSGSVIPGSDYTESMFVRRAWAELYTPWFDLKVGRMASNWGMGLLANDGSCDRCYYGDIVDRVMISTSRLDPVRLSFAVDMRSEGFINRNDDTHSFLLSGGYLGEVHRIGGYLRWTRQPSNKFNVVHGDIWATTRLGPLSLELEALILWGQAEDTELGVENLSILAGGGALDAVLSINPWEIGFQLGVASGDSNGQDNEWHTLTMDRDHNIGLLMFEQPMPVYAHGDAATEENQNIDLSRQLTGSGVSNAVYLRPRFHIDIREDLRAGVILIAAFPAVKEAFPGEPDAYGLEIDVELLWTLYGNFELGARAGFLFPGEVFGENRDFTFGGDLRALVHF